MHCLRLPGRSQRPNSPDDLPIRVVVPAYILSELKAGFCDRRGSVFAVSADRHGDGGDNDIDWHVPVAAGGGIYAAEDPAVRDGGWMEPAGAFAAEELLGGAHDA